MPYTRELDALKSRNLLRKREIFSDSYTDFASNDYLGLSNRKKLAKKALKLALNPALTAPRASMLVNGYAKLHQMLEKTLCKINGFQSCVLCGSGFLANIALFESLTRRGDILLIDEEYHASGILATKLLGGRVVFFAHNNPRDLREKLRGFLKDSTKSHADSAPKSVDSIKDSTESPKNLARDSTKNTTDSAPIVSTDSGTHKDSPQSRIIIAIEGIYSMSGDIAAREFADIALESNAILIVDEAHSSGTLGANLLGYFDYYKIPIAPNFIKLGTLSKALGSYGAYILSSRHIGAYLQTRAKPLIYSTALSMLDTALALVNLRYTIKHKAHLARILQNRKNLIAKKLGIKPISQILALQFRHQDEMINAARILREKGILVGAIRPPTAKIPQLRIIISAKHSKKDIKTLCDLLKSIRKSSPHSLF